MSLRKFASVLVGLGLVVGLMGAGIGASFTDSATATTSIHVGTFNIDISSTAPGVVTVDGTSVTYTCPDIQSSAAGSCAFPFTITNTGSMAANITVSATTPASPFSDMLGAVTPFSLAGGAHHDFAAGIQWTELGQSNLNQQVQIVYTIGASA
jgi:hypothetical protein